MEKIEPKFKKGDYIINHNAGDMAIVDKITPKNYYIFKIYYSEMFHEIKDLKKYPYELQVNYQKFWELCTDDEKKTLDKIIKENGEK